MMDFYESVFGIAMFFGAAGVVFLFFSTLVRLRNATRKQDDVSDGTDEIMWE